MNKILPHESEPSLRPIWTDFYIEKNVWQKAQIVKKNITGAFLYAKTAYCAVTNMYIYLPKYIVDANR